jgi:hypothetical protein
VIVELRSQLLDLGILPGVTKCYRNYNK